MNELMQWDAFNNQYNTVNIHKQTLKQQTQQLYLQLHCEKLHCCIYYSSTGQVDELQMLINAEPKIRVTNIEHRTWKFLVLCEKCYI